MRLVVVSSRPIGLWVVVALLLAGCSGEATGTSAPEISPHASGGATSPAPTFSEQSPRDVPGYELGPATDSEVVTLVADAEGTGFYSSISAHEVSENGVPIGHLLQFRVMPEYATLIDEDPAEFMRKFAAYEGNIGITTDASTVSGQRVFTGHSEDGKTAHWWYHDQTLAGFIPADPASSTEVFVDDYLAAADN